MAFKRSWVRIPLSPYAKTCFLWKQVFFIGQKIFSVSLFFIVDFYPATRYNVTMREEQISQKGVDDYRHGKNHIFFPAPIYYTNHSIGILRCHFSWHPSALPAHLHPAEHWQHVVECFFHCHFSHLCHGTCVGGHLHPLDGFWANRDPLPHSNRGHWVYDFLYFDFIHHWQKNRALFPFFDAKLHFCPSVGRHRADDAVYFSGQSIGGGHWRPVSCVFFLPPLWDRKRHLVFHLPQHFSLLQCRL